MDDSRFQEGELIEALQPIRFFALAANLHHFFKSGIYDTLAAAATATEPLASALALDAVRLAGFLQYLGNEGILDATPAGWVVTTKGRTLAQFRGWYTMFIGGYGSTFLQLGDRLQRGASPATRDAAQVGIGSCFISHYDAIPLTRSLMAKAPTRGRRILDIGCGNALYLVEFCKAMPEVEAWGVEPDPQGYAAAVQLVESSGLKERIHLLCRSALDFFRAPAATSFDFAVLGFVLHEILGQSGEAAVIEFLREFITRFPEIHLIVIEVDERMADPQIMRHGLALGYYNPYYLFHPFTSQRLAPAAYWEALFAKAGLVVLARETTSPRVDSTGLELGYLLRRA